MKEREPVKRPKDYENILRNPPERNEYKRRAEVAEAKLKRAEAIELAARHLCFAARTTGGVAGRDDVLCRACDEVEKAIGIPLDVRALLPPPPDTGG